MADNSLGAKVGVPVVLPVITPWAPYVVGVANLGAGGVDAAIQANKLYYVYAVTSGGAGDQRANVQWDINWTADAEI